MHRKGFAGTATIIALLVLLLSACSGSHLESGNPLLKPFDDRLAARVYFIRPLSERFLGVADNRIDIRADGHMLLALSKGEYTLLSLLPGKVVLEARSATTWGPRQAYKVWSRAATFTFEAQKTYYVALRPHEGEFRGVYFRPQLIDALQATEISTGSRAFGAARENPILPPS